MSAAASVVAVGVGMLLLVAPAQAGFGILPGPEGFSAFAENADGTPDSQAGSHPYAFTTDINFNETLNSLGNPIPDENVRDVHVAIPPGLLGNPTVIAACTQAQFTTVPDEIGGNTTQCPDSTAIGLATIEFAAGPSSSPVYNLVPPPGTPAAFGFNIANVPVLLIPHLRPDGSYGLTVDSLNTSQALQIAGALVKIWGVPYDPSHDEQRGSCFFANFEAGHHFKCSVTSQAKPYLTLPASCAGSQITTATADSWQHPGRYLPDGEPDLADPDWSAAASEPLGLDGCNKVPFAPDTEARATTSHTTSSSGLDFEINFEDEGLTNPEGIAQSEIKKAVVTLPQGFTINPSAGAGLSACSLATYEAIDQRSAAACPEDSKVGEVEIESPLVGEKLTGGVFVARQGENPFHSLLALYLVADNPQLGLLVKSAALVQADPTTGRLTTTVDEIPQLPFSHFKLHFTQGQTSPLVSPPACGTYTVAAKLYPWSTPVSPLEQESSFQITQGPEGLPCPSGGVPPFHPGLEAGTVNNAAGTYSPFFTHITRKDSEQEITHFSIKLPPGLSGKLVGVAQCSDAAIAAAKSREHELGGEEELQHPSCPQSSEVGHTLVGTGVGNVLAYAPGKLYLAGPYKGSNLSIVSITAAKVGPFDLGTVVIREGLKVDPVTAQVSVDGAGSDPIPHIVDGIPVHLRDIRIYVDRPNFTINPTSCAKMSTAATVLGSGLNFASEADDQPVTVTSPFQAADCASLGFEPGLGLRLVGQTRRGGLPKLVATVTYPKGGSYANIAQTIVTLPHSELLEQGHIGTSCTRVQFNAGGGNGEQCPAKSVYGHAKAITPLLEEPVEGPVYLRSNGGERQLPDLVAALHSKDINVDLVGFIDSVHKKGSENSSIRTRFLSVPDAPVSKFTLEMLGGKKGLLINATNLCKGTHRAKAQFTGQNGKLLEAEPTVQAQCGKGKGKGKGNGGKKGAH